MKEIVDILYENRQIELAKSILESKGYNVTKRITRSSVNESIKPRKLKRLARGLKESLITNYIPEDVLRSEFKKHNFNILDFKQGNLVKVKTSHGNTLTFKIVKNDEGEYEVLNPNHKLEFIIKDED